MKPVTLGMLLLSLVVHGASVADAQTALERVERRVKDLIQDNRPGDEPVEVVDDPVGYLGVIANNPEDGSAGVLILEVLPDGPADRAGLKVGDRIERIGEADIVDMEGFAERMQSERAGGKLAFAVDREGKQVILAVTLGRRPAADKRRFSRFGRVQPPQDAPPPLPTDDAVENMLMGILIEPVTPQRQQELGLPEARGAHVLDVLPASPAAKAGITAGAVIVAVDGRRVSEPADLTFPRERAGSEVKLAFYKSGKLQERKLRLAAPEDDTTGGNAAIEEMPLPEREGDAPIGEAAADQELAQLRKLNRKLEARIEQLEKRLQALEAKAK